MSSCVNQLRDGLETGVDCGGGTCPPCALGSGCTAAADCLNGYCLGGICVLPLTCMNHQRDLKETDVDCGGGNCAPCPEARACSSNSDCLSNNCVSGACRR